jgi:hypothetical protein
MFNETLDSWFVPYGLISSIQVFVVLLSSFGEQILIQLMTFP